MLLKLQDNFNRFNELGKVNSELIKDILFFGNGSRPFMKNVSKALRRIYPHAHFETFVSPVYKKILLEEGCFDRLIVFRSSSIFEKMKIFQGLLQRRFGLVILPIDERSIANIFTDIACLLLKKEYLICLDSDGSIISNGIIFRRTVHKLLCKTIYWWTVAVFTILIIFVAITAILINDFLQILFKLEGYSKELFPKRGDFKKGLVSVVILNWNGRHLLKDILDSLRKQSFRNFETILVDNGSVDNSKEFIVANYPQVKVIENEKNLGFARGVNIGIKEARGEFIALLNTDVTLDENWIEEMIKAFVEKADISICGCKIYLAGLDRVFDIVTQGFGKNGRTVNVGAGKEDLGQFDEPKECFGVSACAVMYRRQALEDIGIFDEDFLNCYEDNDLHFRAQLLGRKCYYNPEAIAHHIGSATIKSGSYLHLHYICKNSINPMIKNLPASLILKNFPKILIAPLKEFKIFVSQWFQPKATITGIFRAFFDLWIMLPKRKYLNRARRVSIEYIESLLV